MMNNNLIKILGVATTFVGAVATLAGDWVDNKKMKAEVAKQVANAIKNIK